VCHGPGMGFNKKMNGKLSPESVRRSDKPRLCGCAGGRTEKCDSVGGYGEVCVAAEDLQAPRVIEPTLLRVPESLLTFRSIRQHQRQSASRDRIGRHRRSVGHTYAVPCRYRQVHVSRPGFPILREPAAGDTAPAPQRLTLRKIGCWITTVSSRIRSISRSAEPGVSKYSIAIASRFKSWNGGLAASRGRQSSGTTILGAFIPVTLTRRIRVQFTAAGAFFASASDSPLRFRCRLAGYESRRVLVFRGIAAFVCAARTEGGQTQKSFHRRSQSD
jgi:hypothetical protein